MAFPPRIKILSEPVIFSDHTSVIISGQKSLQCHIQFCLIWEHSLLPVVLALNLEIIQWKSNNSPHYPSHMGYDGKHTEETKYKIPSVTKG